MKKKLLLLPLLLLGLQFSSIVNALTLDELRTEIRVRVKDVGTSGTRQTYSDTQLTNMINEAQRDVVNATWVLVSTTQITLTSGVTYYNIPDSLIAILRVTDNDKFLPETTQIKLDGEFGSSAWKRESGSTPQSYYQDPSRPGQIGVYPFPNSSVSSTLLVTFVQEPTDLSSDSDVPFLGRERFTIYHDLIVFYFAYRIFLIEGNTNKFTIYRQEYESRLQMMRDRIGSKPNYVPSFSGGPSR